MKKRAIALLLAFVLLLGVQGTMLTPNAAAASGSDLSLSAKSGFTGNEMVAHYLPGETAATLEVEATGGAGGYKYQWYYTTEAGANAKATELPGETGTTFTPDAASEAPMRFYYCVVTDSAGATARSVLRQPVIVGETPTVTAYFSLTDDKYFVVGDNDGGGSGKVMAMQKVTVPYFDLALYGLGSYYFSSETYGEDPNDPGKPGSSLEPGTSAFAYGKITDLHLLIYMLELHALGLTPEQAGKGLPYQDPKLRGEWEKLFEAIGSTGSLFMKYWGHSSNLTYYHNYKFPLASEGWGATSDQVLLHDGDILTVSMYSSQSFYSDSNAGYHHLGTEDQPNLVTQTVKQGETLTLTLYRSWGDLKNPTSGGTFATKVANAPIYRVNAKSMTSGAVKDWIPCGTTDEKGAITLVTKNLAPGTYLFSADGQKGSNAAPEDYVSCPGGILVTVTGGDAPEVPDTPKPLYGDVNGDGAIDVTDVTMLQRRIAQLLTEAEQTKFQIQNADVSGDGSIDVTDVTLLQQRIAQLIKSFPVESKS